MRIHPDPIGGVAVELEKVGRAVAALFNSKLDDARSPWVADGLVSVGVGSGLAVLTVQASPRSPLPSLASDVVAQLG